VGGSPRDRADPGESVATLPLDAGRTGLVLSLLGAGLEVEVEVEIETGGESGVDIGGERRAVWTIGRAPDNDVVVDHPSVSRQHARLRAPLRAGDGFALEALSATNPLRFGGKKLDPGERVAIQPGEAFAIGALVGVIRPGSRARHSPAAATPSAPGDVPAAPARVASGSTPSEPRRALREVLALEERRRIVEALRKSGGNQSRAAELLGMPRRTLVKRLRDYAIPRGRVVPDPDPGASSEPQPRARGTPDPERDPDDA
jgi:hypothetical protein